MITSLQMVAKEFAKVDLSSEAVIHSRAVAMAQGLSKVWHSSRPLYFTSQYN
jgi:hypothetical protein